MKVYGQLEKAQLENLSADPTFASTSLGYTYYNTALDTIRIRGLLAWFTVAQSTGALDASLVVVTPSGNLASTDAQSALIELQLNIDNLTTANVAENAGFLYYTATRVNTLLAALTGDVTFSAGVTTIGATKVTNAMLAGSIAYSKLSLTGAILNADLAGSIAYSKLSLTGAILNADLAGSIAYSKLSLTGAILNADLAGSIAYSKLSLTGAILNADLAGSIAASKLVGSDIATVGTITSGVWSGTIITAAKGGTGASSSGSTGVAKVAAGTWSWATIVDADIAAGTISAAKLVGTDIATVGTITAGVWSGTAIALNKGGTGQTTKAPAFDALSPMSASGDLIYGGASGTGTRLAKGTDGQVLTLASGLPTWATASGGGGGGSLQWIEDQDPPLSVIDNTMRVYKFQSALTQNLYTLVKVPVNYVAGGPIKLRTAWYSADSSGTALISAQSTLMRTGTTTVSATTNQRTTSNTAVTMSAGTANILQAVILDITDSTGNVNGQAVAAGDFLKVRLYRGTDTGTSDVFVPPYGAEVTFT